MTDEIVAAGDVKISKPAEKPKEAAKRKPVKARTATAKTVTAKKAAPKKAASAARTLRNTVGTAQQSRTQTVNERETTMTQGKVQFEKLAQEASSASKEQMDALMKSGSVFMKGFEDLTKAYLGLAQKTAEKNTQTLKTLMACKDIKEVTEVQNKWAQQNFDDFMSGATKISEISVKLANDAFSPINDQLNKAIKKASEAMAA